MWRFTNHNRKGHLRVIARHLAYKNLGVPVSFRFARQPRFLGGEVTTTRGSSHRSNQDRTSALMLEATQSARKGRKKKKARRRATHTKSWWSERLSWVYKTTVPPPLWLVTVRVQVQVQAQVPSLLRRHSQPSTTTRYRSKLSET